MLLIVNADQSFGDAQPWLTRRKSHRGDAPRGRPRKDGAPGLTKRIVLTNQSDSVFQYSVIVGASGFPNQIETAEEYLRSTKKLDEAVELAGCPQWHEACLNNRVRQVSPQPS